MSIWTTAVLDLRTLLSDGPTDRYAYRKKCFGSVNGTNLQFKTLEYRRVTDFTATASPLGVYVAGVAASTTADDTPTGEFTLTAAPTADQDVEATYYYQWFLDTELVTFLGASSEWLGFGPDYTTMQEGLRPAAKYYAAQEAMHKQAARWVERISNQFLVEDAPDPKNLGIADTYRKIADDYKKKSVELRDQFYTRQGQSLAPLFSNNFGHVREIVPRR